MTEQTGDGGLELEVRDFGPIIEAKVNLRPLTVFVGPSNTGKSYLAILIYALHRVFSGDIYPLGRDFRGRSRLLSGWYDQDLPEESLEALYEVLESLAGTEDSEASGQSKIVLPSLVADMLRSKFNELSDLLSSEITRCFGVSEARALIRRGKKNNPHIIMRRRINDPSNLVQHELMFGQETKFTVMVPKEVPIPTNFEDEDELRRIRRRMRRLGKMHRLSKRKEDSPLNEFLSWEVLQFLSDTLLELLLDPLHLSAYYLPADRTGVMHAHSVVVSALIGNAPTAGLRPAVHTPMLSGVLADFLKQLITIDQIRHLQQKTERDLGKNIESVILDGSIRIDRSPHVDYPRFAYRPHGWKNDLALANASSMVSELAPVVLYLRHMIKPGNVLIVEEPESHLHPAMQVEFTRQLAVLVEEGIRVIVTTHSEWLLEELTNIVLRSQVPKAEQSGNKNDRPALRPDQVGAWLFKPKSRPKGSIVKKLHFDESGLCSSGYDEVAIALHNDWADITSRNGSEP